MRVLGFLLPKNENTAQNMACCPERHLLSCPPFVSKERTLLSETCSVPASPTVARLSPRLTPSQSGVNSGATHRTTNLFFLRVRKAVIPKNANANQDTPALIDIYSVAHSRL
jgi:hypothetical protein